MNSIQAVWTLVAFVVFVGIVIWAFSSKRSQDFHEASMLAFEEDDMHKLEQDSGDKHHV
ncbi:cbb3-type cytochrome oxidase subunit 3 [Sulfuriflexus mobilis]|uniref:cbb3-type cytochrome oxidase subunit 3 n=1 Tax=Sulfuriflexus mobilis TaxID=1811807 RepID=UPI001559D74B|nr:cbb3-type cytochrome c oxidase subunit 3 [Sulfuriflexus mobilis]